MGKKSQNTESGGKSKPLKTLKSLEKPFKKRKSTLKKSASELEILCRAQVCCVMEEPTGDVVVWPENHADAVSIITKYKQSKKKAKLNRSTTNLEQLEEENKDLAMGDEAIDQSLKALENLEGFDIDQFLNNTMLFEDENKGFDNIDQFLMSNIVENVEPNEGFDTGGIFEIAEPLNYEEHKDFDQKGFSFGDEGLDSLSGESGKHIADFSGSNIDTVDQGITSSVEGDDHDQQNFEYHVLNNGSNSLEVEDNNDLSDHDIDQVLNDFLDTVGFPECSRINAHISTAPDFEHHQIDNVCGMWPSDTLRPSPQYSGLEGAYYLPNHSTKFENENSNISPFLSSLDEQPKLMGSNKSIGDIGRN